MALSPSGHDCSLQALGFYTRFVTGEVAIPCVISTPYHLPVIIGVRLGGLLSNPNLFNASDFQPSDSEFGMALANATSNAAVNPDLVRVLVAPVPPAAATNNGKMSVLLELCHGETGQLLVALACADLPIAHLTEQAAPPPSSQHPTTYPSPIVNASRNRSTPNRQKAAPRANKKQSTSARSQQSASSNSQSHRPFQPVVPAGPPPLRVIGSGMISGSNSGSTSPPKLITFGCFQHDIAGELAVPVILLNPTSHMFELWVSCNGARVSYQIRLLNDKERLFPGLSPEEAHGMRVLLVSNAHHLIDPRGCIQVEIGVHTLSGVLVVSGQCATLYWNPESREWSSVTQYATGAPSSLPNPLSAPPFHQDMTSNLPYQAPSTMNYHPASLAAIQEEGESLELESASQQIAPSLTSGLAPSTSHAMSTAPPALTDFQLAMIDEDDETEPQNQLTQPSPLSSPDREGNELSSAMQSSPINASVLDENLDVQSTDMFAAGSVESHTGPPADPEINPLRFPWRNPALYHAATEYEVSFHDGGEGNGVSQRPKTPSKPSPSTTPGASAVQTSESRSKIPDSPSSARQQRSSPAGVPPALTIIAGPDQALSPDLSPTRKSATPQAKTGVVKKGKALEAEAKENAVPNAGGATRTSRETSNRAQPYTKTLRFQRARKGAAGRATKDGGSAVLQSL